MITFVFDKQNQWGFVPNLAAYEAEPKTKEWWDLAITAPYSYEFRFLKYMDLEGMEYACKLVTDVTPDDDLVIYPIWINMFDPDYDYIGATSEYARNLAKGEFLTFAFFYSEGDDPTIDIIDNIFDWYGKYDLPLGSIRFVIANYKVKDVDPFIYFCDDEVYYRYLHIIDKNYVKTVNLEQRKKKFTCLNRMDKPFRRLFAASLWHHGAHNDGYLSYNQRSYSITGEENTVIEGDNYWAPYFWNKYFNENDVLIEQFLLNCPFRADNLDDQQHNNHKLILDDYFKEAYWNFVVETHFDHDTVFLTEKTFKPILNLQPFIIIGSPGSLDLLHSLGYKTFDGYISEEYDVIEDDEDRMHSVLTEALAVAESDHEGLTAEIAHFRTILEHNQQNLLASKRDRLQAVIDKLLE
jgi:hypothetical protein